eukprot:CAMPEP_0113272304 /NCGR_PEP_ID=MMETSP0008_2-20120614/23252_1 /TAXON_ID=97485 /ORGANISM="Prymnesium parvum" /LENGTH=147 /DNA_ID=CAMNT_0000121757 /DNA_START=580 /DNA_END=1020 /DNA_ORIENTATION=- /assembly_acc=CAM_ASM_000153
MRFTSSLRPISPTRLASEPLAHVMVCDEELRAVLPRECLDERRAEGHALNGVVLSAEVAFNREDQRLPQRDDVLLHLRRDDGKPSLPHHHLSEAVERVRLGDGVDDVDREHQLGRRRQLPAKLLRVARLHQAEHRLRRPLLLRRGDL